MKFAASAVRRLAVTLVAASVISNALALSTPMPNVTAVQEETPAKPVSRTGHIFHRRVVPMSALQWYRRPLTLPKIVFPQPTDLDKTITVEQHQPVIVHMPADAGEAEVEVPAYDAPPELPEAGYEHESLQEASVFSNVASEDIAAPEPDPGYTNEFPQVNDSSFQ